MAIYMRISSKNESTNAPSCEANAQATAEIVRSFCDSHAHPFNPNPISKCVVLVLAGLCVFKHLPTEIPLFITLLAFLYLNDYRATVLKALIAVSYTHLTLPTICSV